jgi:5-methylcytosine-specific restriction endonuclease McrA
MEDIHYVRNFARRIGLRSWLSTVEGRLTIANILHIARCKDAGLPVDDVTVPDLTRILEKQGYRCVYCPYRIVNDFHLDHLISIAKGAGHTLSNIQFTCPPCNWSKGDGEKPQSIRRWPKDADYLPALEGSGHGW